MPNSLPTLKDIRKINEQFPYNDYVREWKDQGRKVMGWTCSYAPEEIIQAGGLLPVRVMGGFKQMTLDLANSYLYPTTCSAVRSYVQLVLEKKYDFLDGLVAGTPCDHGRRFFDVWEYFKFTPFNHIMSVPTVLCEEAVGFYAREISELGKKLEGAFGGKITTEALWEAIELFNTTRQLLRQLSEFRKLENPPITGAEYLEVSNACMTTPKEPFNRILDRLVKEAALVKPVQDRKIRLMLTGSPLNNPDFVRFIEDQGCVVVAEELCTADRYWIGLVDTDRGLNPIQALARRYIYKFPCHRTLPWDERFKRVLEFGHEFRVDGVINQMVRYCTSLGFERPLLRKLLEGAGIPVLDLELEYGSGGTGQIKTRIQAFLEMIQMKMGVFM